jgi:hypothetical protein
LYRNYQSMITEQMNKIIAFGLLNACDKMYIGISYPTPKAVVNVLRNRKLRQSDRIKFERLKGFMLPKLILPPEISNNHPKVTISYYERNHEETDTLRWVRDYCKTNPDDYVFYFHTKGITKQSAGTEDWRRYMEYFVIENWQDCVLKLDEGFDCCGVLWNRNVASGFRPHFSGGMWWATAKYINKLNHRLLETSNRYDRELWIGSNPTVNCYEFHNSRMNDISSLAAETSHYTHTYPRSNYEKKPELPKDSLIALNVEDGFYLTDKGKIHGYLDIYEELFRPLKDKEITIFEVGYQYGGSCRLWEKYFPNAQIRAVDITAKHTKEEIAVAGYYNLQVKIKKGKRVKLEIKDIMALTEDYFKDFSIDIAIDDGSHKLEDQIYFINLVYPFIKKGGLLIVEDVQDIDQSLPAFMGTNKLMEVIDRRTEIGINDEILIIFKK